MLDAPRAIRPESSMELREANEEPLLTRADSEKVRKRDHYRRATAIVGESVDLARRDIVKRAGLTESFAEKARAMS